MKTVCNNPFCIFSEGVNIALICLNSNNNWPEILFRRLWTNAKITAAVDGFANRLYDGKFRDTHLPNFLTGDFDSVRPGVLEFYKTIPTVQVIHTPDQDATDFTKCLEIVSRAVNSMNTSDPVQKIDYIVALYGSGGRTDHELGILKTLFIARDLTELPVLLVTESSISWLLLKGSHVVMLESQHIGTHCGLIPIGYPSTVTTTGLVWNLDNQTLDFEGLISTSNKVKDSKITIVCDHPVLFTIENLVATSP